MPAELQETGEPKRRRNKKKKGKRKAKAARADMQLSALEKKGTCDPEVKAALKEVKWGEMLTKKALQAIAPSTGVSAVNVSSLPLGFKERNESQREYHLDSRLGDDL